MNTPIGSISRWYFSRRALPYWYVLIVDCAIVVLAGLFGAYMILGGGNLVTYFWKVLSATCIISVVFALYFHLFHTYRGIVRFTSIVDLQRIVYATAFGTLTSVALCAGFMYVYPPDTYLYAKAIDMLEAAIVLFGISTLMIWLVRVTVKIMYDTFRSEKSIPIAIYGTKAGGVAIAKSIVAMPEKSYRLGCFISDAQDTVGGYLMGKIILPNTSDIGNVLRDMHIGILFVSPLKRQLFRQNSEMIDSLTSAGIKILMLPGEQMWTEDNELHISQMREINIEDLLMRDKIEVDTNAIGTLLRNKRVLITGAAGSIGSEMVRQVAQFHPEEMVLIDQAETPMHDIRLLMEREYSFIKCETIVSSIANQKHMENIFSMHRPQYVFHAAAYKHVPMMEYNPAIAVQNNIYGTRVIADLAVKYGTEKFVMISTDKAVNPTNVMGCSKRICEIYCQSLNNKLAAESKTTNKPYCQFVTTRFGNVLGSNGSVIPLFREQLKRGGPLTVTHPDIIRYFMLIPEACRLVLEAGTMGHGGEIYVFDMGKPVRILDLANRMIKLSGAKNIEIKFTGLREGEKLYEEVLSDKEQTMPTDHPLIKVAKVREYDYETACRNEKELLELSYTHDDMKIVRKMKDIVPEYKSKVSKYEILDK